MKRLLFVCLLALGMNATTKAQCPINEILTTRDPQIIAGLIDQNIDCIKQNLVFNSDYQGFKMYVDYLFNSSATWIYHTNPQKEKLFADFYAKWGTQYPNLHAQLPESGEFYKAMKEMVATDPEFFKQDKRTLIPAKYKEWMFVQDLTRKYGQQAVARLENAAAKIANLPAVNTASVAFNNY
jgi:hypothetical protein